MTITLREENLVFENGILRKLLTEHVNKLVSLALNLGIYYAFL